jgi:chemotaxis signal transduction protein
MKKSKCLIFKVDQQKFAIKSNNIVNILEHVKLIKEPISQTSQWCSFSFRGINIPLINIRNIMGLEKLNDFISGCVLVVELKINNKLELAGISIDEIVEISELDDFMSYPYMPVSSSQKCDIREAIVLHNGESVIVINVNKLSANQIAEDSLQDQKIFIPN